MKSLLLCLLVLVAVGFCLSEANLLKKRHHPFTTVRTITKNLKRYSYEFQRREKFRMKRQSASCFADIAEVESSKFQQCQSAADEMNDGTEISSSTIYKFCSVDCGNYLLDLLNRIAKDCPGASPSNIDEKQVELLRASCKHDPHNRYCLSDWNSFSVDGFSPDYTSCVRTPSHQLSCASDCKLATKNIISDYGCCYSYVVDLSSDSDEVLKSTVFSHCKVSTPKHCTS